MSKEMCNMDWLNSYRGKVDREKLKYMIKNKEDVRSVDTSEIKDMSGLFYGEKDFNQDISGWDVSNVVDMMEMFSLATSFNQYIGDWDVSNVTNMNSMFSEADHFNQDISGWNVSKVKDMRLMFSRATLFNQNINKWNVSNVTNMGSMFENAKSFNQDLFHWNLSNVTNTLGMFFNAESFNKDISGWNVSSITNMDYMFYGAKSFKQNISGWDLSNVNDMSYMFSFASSFNVSEFVNDDFERYKGLDYPISVSVNADFISDIKTIEKYEINSEKFEICFSGTTNELNHVNLESKLTILVCEKQDEFGESEKSTFILDSDLNKVVRISGNLKDNILNKDVTCKVGVKISKKDNDKNKIKRNNSDRFKYI